jgi:adenylosuccinate synthase
MKEKGRSSIFSPRRSDVVVRPQGGNNAGHTVISEGMQYILHLIPSGILWPGKLCVIGNGVVMDPIALLKEIDGLIDKGSRSRRRTSAFPIAPTS